MATLCTGKFSPSHFFRFRLHILYVTSRRCSIHHLPIAPKFPHSLLHYALQTMSILNKKKQSKQNCHKIDVGTFLGALWGLINKLCNYHHYHLILFDQSKFTYL